MTIRIHYYSGGEHHVSSVSGLLTQGKEPSTRMMKYLIALTEVLIEKNVLTAKDLTRIARAYEVDVTVAEIEIKNFLDISPKGLKP